MRLEEAGYAVRRARLARGLTQAQLARLAGLSRVTVNRLELGRFPDLGVRKLQALLDHVGLALAMQNASGTRPADFVRLASTTASVSFKQPLSEAELILALQTGQVPPGKRPHFRQLLEEASPALRRGLVREVTRWTKPGKVERSLAAIARDVGATDRVDAWLKTV